MPDFQLSLAIGKEGQNARLAARLTGWRIDIRSDEAARAAAPERGARGPDSAVLGWRYPAPPGTVGLSPVAREHVSASCPDDRTPHGAGPDLCGMSGAGRQA